MSQAHSKTTYDVVIIGTGIAGLSTAIKLSDQNLNIALLTREKDENTTNTFWAQGGIIYPRENFELLVDDIQKASAHTSNLEAANLLARRAGKIVEEILLDKGKTDFTRNGEAQLKFTMEAAHSEPRIIYKGDYTGKTIQQSMLQYLREEKYKANIDFLTAHTSIDLITPGHHGGSIQQRYEPHQVVGVYALDQKNKKVKKIISKYVVLATGGIGALYLHHSNAEGSRGDGQGMAQRVGAELINMEFIQFHPTTFYDRNSHRRFLISEAVRGEGGILINAKGEQFMGNYHPNRELAPRDVVARSILNEMLTSGESCVYLDISFKENKWIKNRFPTIYAHSLEKGVDITKAPIPVVPAAHYTLGGVKTNLKGETSIDGLYAVGEVACTGIHGANRLASTSLLEGLTFGYIAAEDILNKIQSKELYSPTSIKEWTMNHDLSDAALVSQDLLTIKQTMWNYVGPIRSRTRLKRAFVMFSELYQEILNFYFNCELSDDLIGLKNGIEMARTVVSASMRNRQSVGCFYLKD